MFTGYDLFIGQRIRVLRSGQSGIDTMRDKIEIKYRFCSSGHGNSFLYRKHYFQKSVVQQVCYCRYILFYKKFYFFLCRDISHSNNFARSILQHHFDKPNSIQEASKASSSRQLWSPSESSGKRCPDVGDEILILIMVHA